MDQDAGGRAKRLRAKAAELRSLAEESKTFHIRVTLLCLAEDYEKLSMYAERRAEESRTDDRRAIGSRALRAIG